MSRKVAMAFGVNKGAEQARPGLKFITSGEVNDDSVVTFTFEPGALYMLYTKEWTTETGAHRGFHEVEIATQEEGVFGTVAVAHTNVINNGSWGVTITYVNDGTVTATQSNNTYSFRYALYRIF